MAQTLDARAFQQQLQRLDDLVQAVEQYADPSAREHTREIVRAVLELHGAGLERILMHLDEAGELGASVRDACARDDVVGGLLLLHGLHPVDLETRVLQALDQVRPYLRSHGGNVELLGVCDGVVRLRLLGSCHGCPSSVLTMKQSIEEAVFARAPDVTAIEVEGQSNGPAVTTDGRVVIPLPIISMP